MRRLGRIWALCVIQTGSPLVHCRVTNGNVRFNIEKGWNRGVGMATSPYGS